MIITDVPQWAACHVAMAIYWLCVTIAICSAVGIGILWVLMNHGGR